MEEHDLRAILEAFAEALADLLQDADLVRAGPEEISITTELAMKMTGIGKPTMCLFATRLRAKRLSAPGLTHRYD